ncbi:MAG: flagellar filament capping protein FliD [Oscillospiraceae bacterium]|nr:flagellar filament capping protein FliD [Oscillospiraceae bacterium]
MAISNLRLSGINSGYDTEAMIEQMLTSYQSKIDIQNKKLTKLTWQQDAYRDIISKVTGFKNKYFDILKKDSYLLSPTSFSKFKATIAGKTLGDSARGISATTSSSSAEGSYKITVSQLATATTAKGKTVVPQNFKLDLETAAKNSTYTENEDGTRTYNFSLDFKVGDASKTIEFSAENIALGADGKVDMESFSKAVTESLNAELQKQFGRTGADTNDEDGIDDYFVQVKANEDGTLGFDINGNVNVSVTEKEGSFGLAKFSKSITISAMSAVTGTNTVSVSVNGESKKVSFEGVSDTYFDSRDEKGNEKILAEYNELKLAAYRNAKKLSSSTPVSQADLDSFTYTSAQAARDKNTAALEEALNDNFYSATFIIDEKGNVTATRNGVNFEFSMTSVEGGTLGLDKGTVSNKVAYSTKLVDLGITGNDIVINGNTGETVKNYSFEINGKKIQLSADAAISDLVEAVNSSGAGVTMSYSNLTGSFEIKSNTLGATGTIEFGTLENGEPNRILQELGLTNDSVETGKNALININGVDVYHNSNTYTLDGTTFVFDDNVTIGEQYEVNITKSYDDLKQAIRDFVNDYNQLIDDVYNYIGTSPARDSKNNLYEPLTDAEKAEMSEEEIKKWEEQAKKGVLYQDSTVSTIMTQLRSALYNTVTLEDGTKFGLFNMGIKTVSYLDSSTEDVQRGKLTLDEDALEAAFINNVEAVQKLFTDPETGVMSKVNNILDNAVRTTGTAKGTLINKAGLATGTTSKDNYIYRQMQSVQQRINTLQKRYDSKEEYWWKIFTNLEKVMADMNDQSSYLSSYLSGYGNNSGRF